jgi:leader peptidase (prepilin peptidase) / N-methyltransferase
MWLESMRARQLLKIQPSLLWAEFGVHGLIIAVAVAAVAASLAIAPNAGGMLAAGLALTVIAIAVIDARHLIIPDGLNAFGAVLGLLHAGLAASSAVEAIALAALRGAVLALVFLAVRAIYRRLRGREGIGLGDVKLAAVAGVWLDWHMMPIAIDIAATAALAVYMTRQLASGRSIRPTGRIPFGLFLAPAIWIGWLLDRWLMDWWS